MPPRPKSPPGSKPAPILTKTASAAPPPTYGHNHIHGLRDAGDPNSGNKTIIIEFSSPNIVKKFHAGHLRSTIMSGFLSKLYESSGYNMARMNYLGDWGRQYGLLAYGYERYADEQAFAADPIGYLFYVYVKINADFAPEEEAFKAATKRGQDTSQLEDGDEDVLRLWRHYRGLSIQRYQETYTRLSIHFTIDSGESQVSKETMEKALGILKGQAVAEPKDGA